MPVKRVKLNDGAAYSVESDPAILTCRGYRHRRERNYPRAFFYLNRALNLQPNNVWALVTRGDVFRMQGDFANALTDLNLALTLHPNNILALACLGYIHGLQGSYAQALTYLNHALTLQPDNLLALVGRGYVYRMQGDFANALTDLNLALRREPDNALALVARGDIFRMQGELPDAFIDVNLALMQEPKNILALHARRDVLFALDRENPYSGFEAFATLDDFRAYELEGPNKEVRTLLSLAKFSVLRDLTKVTAHAQTFSAATAAGVLGALRDHSMLQVVLRAQTKPPSLVEVLVKQRDAAASTQMHCA